MDSVYVKELLDQYKTNYDNVNELALNTVANIDIPVCNTLCSMSKQKLLILLNTFDKKFKTLNTADKCLMITLITDAITSMIKYTDFYDSFDSGNINITDVLFNAIKGICLQVREDEIETLKLYIKQMIKYSERIPHYPNLINRLSNIRFINLRTTISNFTVKQNISNISADQPHSKDDNGNILKESNIPTSLKRKNFETKIVNSYIYNDIKPKIDTTNLENRIIKNDIKLPEIKSKNAFDVMMLSAMNKNKKIKFK